MSIKKWKPDEIETESFRLITEILGDNQPPEETAAIIKRVIHTTADFEYRESMYFSPGVVGAIAAALKAGAHIVTDTNMAKSGINAAALKRLSAQLHCFIADEDVRDAARAGGTTRAVASMEKAARIGAPVIFALGNAPTALIRICEMYEAGEISPAAVIGVPVGFVNVVEAKEMVIESGIPCIVARGRKGGSNVAAAIVNAILYELGGR